MMHCRRGIWVCIALCLFGAQASAAPGPNRFFEGSQYRRIDPPAPLTEHQGKVEVVEMFLFACPHCYELAPKLRHWLKDKPYVDFHRVPAIAGPSWADQARAYYMIQALGNNSIPSDHPEQIRESLESRLNKAIHLDGKQIYNESSVIDFFVSQGIDEQRAYALYESPEVAVGVNQARLKTVQYGLRGVPAVIVDGRFKTAPYFVHNQEEMLGVLDMLVERARAGLKATTVAASPLGTVDATQGYRDEIRRPPAPYRGPPRTGKQLYKDYCATCHDRTTQGAPMPDDDIEWSIRARKGMQILMLHTIEGYKQYLMPPRGGCGNCSETDLKAALDYILAQAGVKLPLRRDSDSSSAHAATGND